MLDEIRKLKQGIISIGRVLWEKDLVTGLNGNISVRYVEESILITATQVCLGHLKEEDILHLRLDGEVLDPKGKPSTESSLHIETYKKFDKAKAIIHTHTVYTNGYFLENEVFIPRIFESKIYLGKIVGVTQNTPCISNLLAVMEAFERNNVVVLRNHGVVVKGENVFDCFVFVQAIEEAIKTDFIARAYGKEKVQVACMTKTNKMSSETKYSFLSRDYVKEICRCVNNEESIYEFSQCLDKDIGWIFCVSGGGKDLRFRFNKNGVLDFDKKGCADFVITATENMWRLIFNGEVDLFVAIIQKQIEFSGDFTHMLKLYNLWQHFFNSVAQIEVEEDV